jgi:HK97 family phage prohead protease
MPREKRVVEIEIEGRVVPAAEGTPEQRYVSGIGIVYDREVEIWPGFLEKIRRGAFERSIRSGDEIKSFFNHDPSQVLSTTRSRPKLELEDRENGLYFNSPVPPTSYGNDLQVNIERKNVRGASFSFEVDKDGEIVTRDEKGVYHREIFGATLYELGPVTNPAYPQTKVGLRNEKEIAEEIRDRYESEHAIPPEPVAIGANKLRQRKLFLLERRL